MKKISRRETLKSLVPGAMVLSMQIGRAHV